MKSMAAWLSAVLALAMAQALMAAEPKAKPLEYRIEYVIGFLPASGEATVRIRMEPGTGRLQRLRMRPDPERHSRFTGDGKISEEGGVLTWRPGKRPAELRFRYKVDRLRSDGAYDARMTETWALLRADRLIPPVAALAPDGAVAKAHLRFDLPPGWPSADVAYPKFKSDLPYPIINRGRRFQQPLGWMLAGDIGVRRERLEEWEIAVGAPAGSSMRRNDILAIINTLTPELRSAFGRLPKKLLLVGADDPMWRGGLSGPGSLYLHPDRPLISENGSSTLVHELVHVVTGVRGAEGNDWIAEGIAEFYSIELLRRTGLISDARAERAFSWMRSHGRKIKSLTSDRSRGPRTARAVQLIRDLDTEIDQRTDGKRDIDDLTRALAGRGRISTEQLRAAASQLLGGPSRVLQSPLID